MSRGRRVTAARQDASVNEAIANLANHGIVAVRRRRYGEITSVKLLGYGWVSAASYGQMRAFKDAQPYILEVIKGGYMLKAWIWGTEIPLDILASGAALPFGVIIVFLAVVFYVADSNYGSSPNWMSALDIVSLILPFGELWLVYRLVQMIYGDLQGIVGDLAGGPSATSFVKIIYEILTVGAPVPPELSTEWQAIQAIGNWIKSEL